ncbi:MAG: hypothetical protein HY676_03970 [Chloroflexi bacterium]|nr:hypothetical protein [Chloroflexota bacterium]
MPGTTPSSTYTDAEWAKIVDAAKSEGKLMLYAVPSFISWKEKAVRDGMKETYGIDMEMLNLSSAVMLERIQTETRAGLKVADAFIGFPPVMGATQKLGLLSPIDNLPSLKEANNPDIWIYNPLYSSLLVGAPATWPGPTPNYIYSTKVVPPERHPSTLKLLDLLDPWWKQTKICMLDPATTSGQSDPTIWQDGRALGYPDWFLNFFYDLTHKDSGYIQYQLLGTPNPIYTGECGLNWHISEGSPVANVQDIKLDKVTWLADGLFDPPLPYGQAGYAIGGVLKNAPHPNAALVYMNWITSQAGLSKYVNEGGLDNAARRDVPSPIEKIYYPKNPGPTYWVVGIDELQFESYMYARKTNFKMMKEGMSRDAWLKDVKDGITAYWGQFPSPAVDLVPMPPN